MAGTAPDVAGHRRWSDKGCCGHGLCRGTAELCWRRALCLLSSGEKPFLPAHGTSPYLSTARPAFDTGVFYGWQQRAEDLRSSTGDWGSGCFLQDGEACRRVLRHGHHWLHRAAADAKRTDRYRDWRWCPRTELPLLARRRFVRVAGELLDRWTAMDQQPGLQKRAAGL